MTQAIDQNRALIVSHLGTEWQRGNMATIKKREGKTGTSDLIRACLCFQYFCSFVLTQFLYNTSDVCLHLTIYRLSSIFWYEDYMVLIVPAAMCQTICFFFFCLLTIPLQLSLWLSLYNTKPRKPCKNKAFWVSFVVRLTGVESAPPVFSVFPRSL